MSPVAAAEGAPPRSDAPATDPVGRSIAAKDVVVVTTDRVDRTCHDALKVHYQRHPDVAVVLVAGRVTPHDIVAVAPYGVAAAVRAAELHADHGLLERVKALVANGGHRLPSGVGSRLRTAAAGSVQQVLGRPGILLKPAEVDVVVLVAEGLTRAGIAGRLGRGAEHVRYTLKNALERLGVERRAAAVAYAAREGLLWELPDQEAR